MAELGNLIGTGRTAEVYTYGPDKIVKLYLDWCKPEWVDHEFRTAQAVQSLGLPVPLVSEIVEFNSRRGIVYQYVSGKTMLSAFSEKPWSLFRLARQLAATHAQMHRTRVEGLPSLKHRLKEQIMRLEDRAMRDKALAVLATLPEGQAPCHGDYHPDNVIISGSNLVIIDWTNATIGHPLADVARTLLMLNTPYIPPETPAKPLVRIVKRLFHDTYLKHYLRLTGASLDEIRRWMIPVAAARLLENVPGEKEFLVKLLEPKL